jgi:hypothetical protein
MPRVIYFSSQSPRDGVNGLLAGMALAAAVVGAGMAGWQSGGPLWAVLYGLVMLIAFPFLLAFGTILFLAAYPVLAWPGSIIADQLGWTWAGPHSMKRLWLQRLSALVLILPIVILLSRNAVGVLGLITGIAAFGLVVLGLLVVLPMLLFLALFFYALSQSRSMSGSSTIYHWTPHEPPRLPPTES